MKNIGCAILIIYNYIEFINTTISIMNYILFTFHITIINILTS